LANPWPPCIGARAYALECVGALITTGENHERKKCDDSYFTGKKTPVGTGNLPYRTPGGAEDTRPGTRSRENTPGAQAQGDTTHGISSNHTNEPYQNREPTHRHNRM
jgi:hypothetical protein